MRSMLLLAILLSTITSVASAKTRDASRIEAVGLDGRWSTNCHRPASASNPYLVYHAPDTGQPTERRVEPPAEDRVTELLDVEVLKTTRELVWVIAEGEVMLTVVNKLDGNTMRVWSVSTTDGVFLVQNGKGQDGKPTPVFHKCETN